ncbi:MAG: cob(I)yrinic acid a,c-diamide adenosyltransferase [Chloroflexi bacterium]|nr:cob(I)yrinic acid a,c-diamide adenosyltransferase [Chloroflexota bacterium]
MTKIKKGLVIVNTGNGKGKTTAALGMMLRAWGHGMRVCMLQFIKNKNARNGEIKAARKLGLEISPIGDGFTWTSKDTDETIALARHGWEDAKERISSGSYDMVILDEFSYPLHFGWLDVEKVIPWLKENKPPLTHLIITGRNAPDELIEYADLVTEMNAIKHPHNEGIPGQPGVEF